MVPNFHGVTPSGDFALADSASGDVILHRANVVLNAAKSFTTAEVNAGATILPALPGYKYRVVDYTMAARGGNAATATSVDILGTQSASGVKLAAVAVAALTENTPVKPNSANVTSIASSFSACDANTAITIGKTGSNLATATGVDVFLSYVVEVA